MQYVGQTCRFLKTRFSEHYRRITKPRKIDQFLYRYLKQTITLLAVFPFSLLKRLHMVIIPLKDIEKGAQWLSGRVLDSRPRGRGFEPHWRQCVVFLEQDTFILA